METGAIANLELVALRPYQEGPQPAEEPTAPDGVAIVPEEDEAEGGDDNVIIVEGATEAPQGDPAEKLNAATYKVSQAVDEALVEPIAMVYDEALPKPIRSGLGNFLRNLGEPINFLNFMLQLKPGKAFKTLGRFAINTTLGIAGLFDVAAKEPFGLEYEYNGLANTLGYYGVGPGPYLYLPFMGSTTVRDLFGRLVDLSIIPAVAGKPFNDPYFAIPVGALTSLESRIETDSQIDAIRDKCGDPYAANRDLYLIQRKVEIDRLRGRVTADLGEIQERLEFNCDIEIETGYVPPEGESFIEGQTTLLKEESETSSFEYEDDAGSAPVDQDTAEPEGEVIDPADQEPAAEVQDEEEPAALEPA